MTQCISNFEKIPKQYLLISDCRVLFDGSKADCLKYYNDLPNPINMFLYNIKSKREIRR